MARRPMVTRTFESQTVNVLCVDTELGECVNKEVSFARAEKSMDKLLKKCKAELDTDTIKVVQVVNHTEIEELYGMDEDDFMKYAVKLDTETRKPVAEARKPVSE